MLRTATDSPINQNDLRRCLGRFATGVTVVTCVDAVDRPCGITVNSFSSVSLDPPLVLWNIAKVSNSLQAFLDAEYFLINILADSQRTLSAHFAKSDHTLFDNIKYTTQRKLPLNNGCNIQRKLLYKRSLDGFKPFRKIPSGSQLLVERFQ